MIVRVSLPLDFERAYPNTVIGGKKGGFWPLDALRIGSFLGQVSGRLREGPPARSPIPGPTWWVGGASTGNDGRRARTPSVTQTGRHITGECQDESRRPPGRPGREPWSRMACGCAWDSSGSPGRRARRHERPYPRGERPRQRCPPEGSRGPLVWTPPRSTGLMVDQYRPPPPPPP
jgi:hypothetical protein